MVVVGPAAAATRRQRNGFMVCSRREVTAVVRERVVEVVVVVVRVVGAALVPHHPLVALWHLYPALMVGEVNLGGVRQRRKRRRMRSWPPVRMTRELTLMPTAMMTARERRRKRRGGGKEMRSLAGRMLVEMTGVEEA